MTAAPVAAGVGALHTPGAAAERSRPADTAAASEDDREEARHGARPEEERADGGAGHGAPAALRRCLQSEKDAVSAQKLGQRQPLVAVFPRECMGQLAYFGPT